MSEPLRKDHYGRRNHVPLSQDFRGRPRDSWPFLAAGCVAERDRRWSVPSRGSSRESGRNHWQSHESELFPNRAIRDHFDSQGGDRDRGGPSPWLESSFRCPAHAFPPPLRVLGRPKLADTLQQDFLPKYPLRTLKSGNGSDLSDPFRGIRFRPRHVFVFVVATSCGRPAPRGLRETRGSDSCDPTCPGGVHSRFPHVLGFPLHGETAGHVGRGVKTPRARYPRVPARGPGRVVLDHGGAVVRSHCRSSPRVRPTGGEPIDESLHEVFNT